MATTYHRAIDDAGNIWNVPAGLAVSNATIDPSAGQLKPWLPPVAGSPDGTITNVGGSGVVDSFGQRWTCDSAGHVFVDGKQEPQSTAVTQLGVFGGAIHQNSAGGFWRWTAAAKGTSGTWSKDAGDPGFGGGVVIPPISSGTTVKTLTISNSDPTDKLYAYPSAGPFFAHLDPWGASMFSGTWSYQIAVKDTNPHGADMSWILGNQSGNVKTAPQLVWRGADWWAAQNAGITNNFANARGVRMDRITRLTTYVDLTLLGDIEGFGAGMDFYLINTDSHQTQSRDYSYEILIAFRYGAQAGGKGGASFQTAPDQWGIVWDVQWQPSGSALASVMLVICPHNGPLPLGWMTTGNVDLLWLFQQIAAHGSQAKTGAGTNFSLSSLYFTHLRLDCEIAGGNGGMHVNKWCVAYSDNTGIAGNQYSNY